MDSQRLCPPSRRSIRAVLAAGTLVGALTAGGVAHADPEPSTRDLRSQAHKLAEELNRLTEQFNGLRVQLDQSQRAARTAREGAARQKKELDRIRREFGGIAATTYMQGEADPLARFLSAPDPQAVLDQSSALQYFASRDGARVRTVLQAMQASERAQKSADERARQSTELRSRLDAQRKKVTATYEKVRGTLVKRDPAELAKLPVVGTGKSAQALRAAMSKLGRPYVWGAAGPSSFDCSGLTLWAYKQVGINLPHYTGAQWTAGTRISREQLQPGDLVFFYGDLHHMGMYVGGGKMLHAPQTGDVVKIAPMAGRPFAGAVRVA